VPGAGAKTLRAFFRMVMDWHRWLGTEGESRDLGRAITGACNAAFAVMVVTGFYLWWPRRWTPQALKAVMVPNVRLRGKPRDWNWHHTAGFWSASVLICVTLTGLVMSYQWANDLHPHRQHSAAAAARRRRRSIRGSRQPSNECPDCLQPARRRRRASVRAEGRTAMNGRTPCGAGAAGAMPARQLERCRRCRTAGTPLAEHDGAPATAQRDPTHYHI
jgi:uncharacterized iron-regulated membrane protein